MLKTSPITLSSGTPLKAVLQEGRDKTARQQEFNIALNAALTEHAKRSPAGVPLEFYHAQRGQYGKDLFVLMQKPEVDHNKSPDVFWGNPATDKGTVIIHTTTSQLLTAAERATEQATYVMWKHKWVPTYTRTTEEHHVIWPARAK